MKGDANILNLNIFLRLWKIWAPRSSRDLRSLHLEPSAHCRWRTAAVDLGSAALILRI